ncbi:hypothetical protein ACIOD2_15470 [Amycolatopsis sp. NPDC088138]|uniref:hypothetical protein n=1 Tax=Amycolatopsis sp. NPDC088138 TaxID=3363938 RepID=UPI0037F8608F
MPRNRPSSLRRAQRIEAATPPIRVPHLSRRAARELAFAEVDAGFGPGRIARLLIAWDRGTRSPDVLSVSDVCPCPGCDPVGARRDLAGFLRELPRRERALVGAVLSRADRRFVRRTPPDPLGPSPWWFERRFHEQDGWGRAEHRTPGVAPVTHLTAGGA